MTDAAGPLGVQVSDDGDSVEVRTPAYRWRWSRGTDEFVVTDDRDRRVASAPLQPVVEVVDGSGTDRTARGQVAEVQIDGDELTVRYADVNGHARVQVRLRFEEERLWFEPLRYLDGNDHDVVAVHLFSSAAQHPALRMTHLVQPGLSMTPALSPVLPTEIGLDVTSWLGRGSLGPDSQVSQQWGLPVHYFCGLTRDADHNARSSLTTRQSAAFCCGLAELPSADLMLHLRAGAVGLTGSVRSDLWGHQGRATELTVGARLVWAFGADYREAIRGYYRAVLDTGVVSRPAPSDHQQQTLSRSQYNTWGAQCAAERASGRFDQAALEEIYTGLRASGMRPGVFVIDDKWEGRYGVLRHDEERFPDFEQFLARVRADGHRVGLWAAFLRTNDPAAIGLEPRHLMRDRDGHPIGKDTMFASEPYFLLDPTQPEVQAAITAQIKEFVDRYDPDLVKFDFGYELPSLALAMPADPALSGERLLQCALEVIVSALRSAKPDIAVMYYSLSPLLLGQVDQHGHDDMYLAVDEYDLEHNRRLFFSSLLAEVGCSVYGSGGYDWRTMREIWFDTAIAGTVGSLNAFAGDEHDDTPTDSIAATYNGLTAIARPPHPCVIDPVDPISVGSSRGARSRSWVRYEDGACVSVAVRRGDSERLPAGCGVRSDPQVVVSSMTADGLAASDRIGLVAFGSGAIRIETSHDRPARLVHHRLDGTSQDGVVRRSPGAVTVVIEPAAASQSPIEWTELVFAGDA